MNNKIFIILGMAVLLLGVVSASGVIENFQLEESDLNILGGETGQIGFSFDFNDRIENSPDSSLVLRFNITSLDSEFPVWKKDFSVEGMVADYSFIGLWDNTYPLKCVDELFQPKTERGILYEEEILENGTFYCYDPNNYLDMLKLNRNDLGMLMFTPQSSIYPGSYDFSIELMEVEVDHEPPQIEFILESGVYGANSGFNVKFNVTDMYNIDEVKYKISNNFLSQYYNSGWISTRYNSMSSLYEDYFNFERNNLDTSGEYYIWAWACDMLGNCREM